MIQETGSAVVLNSAERRDKVQEETSLPEDLLRNLTETLQYNYVPIVEENPNIIFYFFFPPYSIGEWDEYYAAGQMRNILEAEKIATETLLQYSNVHVFSFLDATEITTNLDNYVDKKHYTPAVCSQLLRWMAGMQHEVTLENMDEVFQKNYVYYTMFDYNTLYEEVILPGD